MLNLKENVTKKVKSILIGCGGDRDEYYSEVTYITKIGENSYEEKISYFGSDFNTWYSNWTNDRFLYQEYLRSKGIEATIDESEGSITNG